MFKFFDKFGKSNSILKVIYTYIVKSYYANHFINIKIRKSNNKIGDEGAKELGQLFNFISD